MTQIGAPPAGWYADPSGQHRARYWDGTAWTEHVTDEPPAHGTGVGGGTDHAAVAGVASAVAGFAGPMSGPGDAGASTGAPSPGTGALPPAGWYRDPAGRHEVRMWDGTAWTDRVGDGGVEAFDPVGHPAGSGVGDLAYGGSATTGDGRTWSVQTLAPGDVGVHPATESGSPTVSSSDFLSLGHPEDDVLAPRAAPERPRGRISIGGWMVLAGAVGLLLGSGMAWTKIVGPRVGQVVTANGSDGDGRITMVLAVVLLLLGASIVTGRLNRLGGVQVGAMGALVAGAAATAVCAVDIADVTDRAERLGITAGATADVGTGLWMAFVASLLVVGGGLLAFTNPDD